MKKTLDQLVDLRTSAIIVIDMQNDFCDPKGAGAKYGADVSTIQDMIPRMQRFFDGARALGAQLIFVQCIHEPSTDSDTWLFRHGGIPRPHCRKGTWGADSVVLHRKAPSRSSSSIVTVPSSVRASSPFSRRSGSGP